MAVFWAILKWNIKRRFLDGFAIGYNLIFPIVLIGLLGIMCRKFSFGGINSYQYYTVVMIPFCIIMSLITAAYAGKDDAYAKTAQRVLVTPVTVQEIVLAKVISCTLAFFFCSMVVYIGAGYFAKIDLNSMGAVGVLLFVLSFAVSSLGTLIGLGMKNFLVLKNILNIPIALFAILGGTFFRIGTFHKWGDLLLKLSPIHWINKSLFMVLYEENSRLLTHIILILAATSGICIVLAIKTFKKGEYMNGDLPDYNE